MYQIDGETQFFRQSFTSNTNSRSFDKEKTVRADPVEAVRSDFNRRIPNRFYVFLNSDLNKTVSFFLILALCFLFLFVGLYGLIKHGGAVGVVLFSASFFLMLLIVFLLLLHQNTLVLRVGPEGVSGDCYYLHGRIIPWDELRDVIVTCYAQRDGGQFISVALVLKENSPTWLLIQGDWRRKLLRGGKDGIVSIKFRYLPKVEQAQAVLALLAAFARYGEKDAARHIREVRLVQAEQTIVRNLNLDINWVSKNLPEILKQPA